MSISAVNNPTAFTAYTNFVQNSRTQSSTMQSLATGTKNVGDDPASVGISESMRAAVGGMRQAQNNADGALSVLNTADSWEQKIHDQLSRMKELAVQASDDTKTDDDRTNLQAEYSELQSEIQRMVDVAQFNGQNLLDGTLSGAQVNVGGSSLSSATLDVDIGKVLDLEENSTSLSSILNSTSIGSASAAESALSDVDDGIQAVAKERASIGAQISRLQNSMEGVAQAENNVRAAESKFRDVDMARQSSDLAQQQALTQVSNAMMAQANQIPQQVLQLIGR